MGRYYLAASFGRKHEVRGYRDDLVRLGHVVTSRWLDEEDGRTFANGTPEDMAGCAKGAEADIRSCDTFVRFSDGRDAKVSGGGRHVETGYARCLRKRMALVGEAQHPWDWLPEVERFADWPAFLATLAPKPRIALVGPMGSGKTTLANLLVERHGFVRLALADEVKDMAADALYEFDITRADIDRDKAVYRPLLQWLGTDLVRVHLNKPTYWIDELLRKATQAGNVPVVCDDVRFQNEADALRAAGFRIVRVVRPDAERPTSGDPNHASEVEQGGIVCDDAVLNDGDLDQLAAAADRLAAVS